MTRHHAEPNVNILLTRNLFFDNGCQTVRPSFMIPLHVCELNGATEPVANLNDVTWFCFCFDFVRSHAQCDCCSSLFTFSSGANKTG